MAIAIGVGLLLPCGWARCDTALVDRLNEHERIATAMMTEAEIDRDIAFRALDNAFASRREAEMDVTVALKSTGSATAERSRQKFAKVDALVSEALDLTAEVCESTQRCATALRDIVADVKAAREIESPRDMEAAVRRIDKLMSEADKSLRLARKSVDALKARWLVSPALQAPTNAPVSSVPGRFRWFGR